MSLREDSWQGDPFLIDFSFFKNTKICRESAWKKLGTSLGSSWSKDSGTPRQGFWVAHGRPWRHDETITGTVKHGCDRTVSLRGRISTFEANLLAGSCSTGTNWWRPTASASYLGLWACLFLRTPTRMLHFLGVSLKEQPLWTKFDS